MKQKRASVGIELVELASVRPYEQNPRYHDAQNIEKLARSIREYGFTAPILVDSANVIVAGHGRYLAAQHLKLERVPIVRLTDLTPDQIRAYRLADNRLALDSEWDKDLLKLELSELFDARSSDIDAIGFTQGELDKLLSPSLQSKEGEKDELGSNTDNGFPQADPNVELEHRCPKCGYEWSGVARRVDRDERKKAE